MARRSARPSMVGMDLRAGCTSFLVTVVVVVPLIALVCVGVTLLLAMTSGL
jgi:nitrate reductase NapE component